MDLLFGGTGKDTIDGGAGNDVLSGGVYGEWTETTPGSGDWVFAPKSEWADVADGDDVLEGGLGDDIFIASLGDDTITVGGNAVQDYQTASDNYDKAVQV